MICTLHVPSCVSYIIDLKLHIDYHQAYLKSLYLWCVHDQKCQCKSKMATIANVRIKRDKQHKCRCETNKLEKLCIQNGPSIYNISTDKTKTNYQNGAGLYLDGRLGCSYTHIVSIYIRHDRQTRCRWCVSRLGGSYSTNSNYLSRSTLLAKIGLHPEWMKFRMDVSYKQTVKNYSIDTNNLEMIINLSQCMRFPTMWYVRPAKPKISLRIRAVRSEPLLVA